MSTSTDAVALYWRGSSRLSNTATATTLAMTSRAARQRARRTTMRREKDMFWVP